MNTKRQYMIFSSEEIDKINFSKIEFNQVLETSAETLRKSLDGTKTFVKWNGEVPFCVEDLTTKEGPYTHEEMLEILATETWTNSELLPRS